MTTSRPAPNPVRLPAEIVDRAAHRWETDPAVALLAALALWGATVARYRSRPTLEVRDGSGDAFRITLPSAALAEDAPLRDVLAALQGAREPRQTDAAPPDGGLELRLSWLMPESGAVPEGALELLVTREGADYRLEMRGRAPSLNETPLVSRAAERIAGAVAALAGGAESAAELRWIDADEETRLRSMEEGAVQPVERLCVHEYFARSARRHPGATAIVHGTRRVTYAELDEAAGRMASHLRAAGVETGTRVALLLSRSPEMLIALLGVLKAGGVYVPLDPAFPIARLRMILEDCVPPVLVTQSSLEHLAEGYAGLRVVLDRDHAEIAAAAAAEGAGAADQFDGDIYVIYTSGSTGRPKGIVQTHAAIANLLQWHESGPAIAHSGVVLQFSSLCFDVHLQEIFPTLAAGGTVCMLDEADRMDPDRLLEVMRRSGVTAAFLSVSTLTRLLGEERLRALPPTLRDVITAGEQLHVHDALREFLAARPELRLHNHYGVSESHVVTALEMGAALGPVPRRPSVGRPIRNTRIQILDSAGGRVPIGVVGEVWIAGVCLAREYLNNEEKTRERFHVRDGARWYRTGDLALWLVTGEIEFLGRTDDQVKIGGHLVEPGDVEAALRTVRGVAECAVIAVPGADAVLELAAWCVLNDGATLRAVRQALAERVPRFMLPLHWAERPALPTGPTGKVDRRALAASMRPTASRSAEAGPAASLEERVMASVRRVLRAESPGAEDNFFDLGADSLRLVALADDLARTLERPVSALDLFQHTSARRLAAHLGGDRAAPATRAAPAPSAGGEGAPIAIVGMAGRFPGAGSVAELWRRLLAGEECLSELAEAERERSPLVPRDSPSGERVTKIGPVEDAESFDASFFGYSELEAAWTDPQHRVFLECAWEALEDAGLAPGDPSHSVGVFAGAAGNTYIAHVAPHVGTMVDYLRALIANDADFLATRASYKLGLRGPGLTVQTGCSTSLVAVHLACRALRNGDCTAALAGGVSIVVPQRSGHFCEDGLIYSPDGSTRPFDADARGTNTTNGAALVVLKPLDAALRDRDRVYAVIRGSAINNDGDRKVGYSAPSHDGQAEVISAALRDAGIGADEIDFVEAHGTATPLGDPIEVGALASVYGRASDERGWCALGSVKGNVGHMNRAAGVAGLIRAALSLHHRLLPPTMHFNAPNPALRLGETPFYVPTEVERLEPRARRLRGAVSSFGIGGTNAHMILEEYPQAALPGDADGPFLLTLSAHSRAALGESARRLARSGVADPAIRLADAALTLNTGRKHLEHRAFVVGADRRELADGLAEIADRAGVVEPAPADNAVGFLFPGQGAQAVGCGAEMYGRFRAFRDAIDEGIEEAARHVRLDLRRAMFAVPGSSAAEELLRSSLGAQLSIVILERALAVQLMDWGIRPRALMGHSTGEYAAACVAGALTLPDCVRLVAARARLMDEVAPRGAMLSALLERDEAQAWVADGVYLAAFNSRGHHVFAGTAADVAALEARFAAQGVSYRRLENHNPNHCALLEPMAAPFREIAEGVHGGQPTLPYVSNLTGGWALAPDAAYWTAHLTHPVRFAEGLDLMAQAGCGVFVEVGPRRGLTSLAGFHFSGRSGIVALPTLPREDLTPEIDGVLRAVGGVWRHRADVDLNRFHRDQPARRVSLPSYPFERRRYWIDAPSSAGSPASTAGEGVRARIADPAEWLFDERWERVRPLIGFRAGDLATGERWLVVGRHDGVAGEVARAIREEGDEVVLLETPGQGGAAAPDGMVDANYAATRVIFCHTESGSPAEQPLAAAASVVRDLRAAMAASPRMWVVTRRGIATTHAEEVDPAAATLAAFARVAPQEDPTVECVHVDLDPTLGVAALLAELAHGDGEERVALRGADRLVPRFAPCGLALPSGSAFRRGGCYLVTGGLGAVGFEVARHLARDLACRVILVGRSSLADAGAGVREARLRTLRELGAGVHYAAADVCDPAALRAALAAGESELGPIDGVIHAAADIAGDRFLAFLPELSAEAIRRQLAPKTEGLRALHEVLHGRALGVRIVFSSVATALGGLGYAAYMAANLACDAIAGTLGAGTGEEWISVNWDVWATRHDRGAEEGRIQLGSSVGDLAMPIADALALLDHIPLLPRRRVLVSTRDLAERYRHTRRLDADAPSTPPAGGGGEIPAADPHDSPVVRAARQAWRKVLRVDEIRADHAFHDLGGDSLSAIKVALEVTRELGVRVSASDMLRAQDFGSFCERVRQLGEAAAPPEVLGPARMEESYPVSALQLRWLRMERHGFGYLDMPVLLRGAVSPELLERALRQVVARHQVLNSVYRADGDDARMVPVAGWQPDLAVEDLRSAGEEEARSYLSTAAERMQSVRFDLAREVPLRANLILLPGDRSVLHVRIHHVAFDGWSSTLFMRDLDAAYAGGEAGPPAPQYAEFAAWQRNYLQGTGVEAQRDYWRRVFEGAPPPTRLPPGLGDGGASLRGARFSVPVGAELERLLTQRARERGITRFVYLVAAFSLLLEHLTGKADLVFGTTAAGRNVPGTEEMMGVFVNPLPLRVRADEDADRLLQQVHHSLAGFHEHQSYVLADLIRHVEPFVGTDINECFHAYILLQNYPKPSGFLGLAYEVAEVDGEVTDPWLRPFADDETTLMREMELIVDEQPSGMSLHFWYRKALFSRLDACAWAERYLEILQGLLAASPDGLEAPLTELEVAAIL